MNRYPKDWKAIANSIKEGARWKCAKCGMQRYVVPEGINIANYKSVAIWCRKFNATFGSAVIQ
uniref:DM13 domain-containing protein n=1 Tax=Cyanothece sp. BG0011 TaxID=2082950 RepID=UPI0018E51545|nr:DM13 domain-containing protein [Cyanothece sp. BG0011]